MRKLSWFLAIAFFATAFLAISAIVCVRILDERRTHAEAYTIDCLTHLGMALDLYYAKHDEFPGPAFADVTKALSTKDYAHHFSGRLGRSTLEGYDAWGNPLCYEIRSPREVIIRSPGANGEDDGGYADDITFRVTPLVAQQLRPENSEQRETRP